MLRRYTEVMLWAGALAVSVGVAAALGQSPGPDKAAAAQIDLHVAGRPLREIADRMSTAAGMSIAVEPRIQEWKATVAYHGRLDALLSLLCSEFRLVVEERPAEAKGTEHARRSLYLRLTDAERRRLDQHEAERLRKERERRERDVKALVDRVHELLTDPDPTAPHGVEGNGLIPASSKPALDLLRSLGPDAISALADSVEPSEDGSVWSQALNLPISNLSPAQRSMVTAGLTNQMNFLQQGSRGGNNPSVNLIRDGLQHLDGGSISFLTVDNGGMIYVGFSVRFGGMGSKGAGFPIFGAAPPLPGSPGQDAPPSGTEARRAAPATPQEQATVTLELPEADYGAAALAVAKAANVNLVADYFTLEERLTAFPKGAPLHDVLERVCGTFHAGRRWQAGSLLLRRDQWEDRVPEEPPAATLDWLGALLEKPHLLTFDEMAQLAGRVNRDQLRGVARWRRGPQDLRSEAREIGSHYALYAWCGSLSQEHLSRLHAGGVRVGALPIRAASAFALLAARRAGLPKMPPAATVSLRQDTIRYPPIIALEVRAPNDDLVGEIR